MQINIFGCVITFGCVNEVPYDKRKSITRKRRGSYEGKTYDLLEYGMVGNFYYLKGDGNILFKIDRTVNYFSHSDDSENNDSIYFFFDFYDKNKFTVATWEKKIE